jgi:hypothetical protein
MIVKTMMDIISDYWIVHTGSIFFQFSKSTMIFGAEI